jgi:hypothetical protein
MVWLLRTRTWQTGDDKFGLGQNSWNGETAQVRKNGRPTPDNGKQRPPRTRRESHREELRSAAVWCTLRPTHRAVRADSLPPTVPKQSLGPEAKSHGIRVRRSESPAKQQQPGSCSGTFQPRQSAAHGLGSQLLDERRTRARGRWRNADAAERLLHNCRALKRHPRPLHLSAALPGGRCPLPRSRLPPKERTQASSQR